MTRALALLLAAFALLLPHGAALAQSGARVVASVSWVEEWDPASGTWVRVGDSLAASPAIGHPAAGDRAAAVTTVSRAGGVTVTQTIIEQPVRFIARPERRGPAAAAIAAFGPFRVLDGRRAALVGATDAASPQAFAAMMAQFPALEVIEFLDAPGTNHDLSNLRLGRAIRAAGLATHVPAGGSARSGAVELFLAGTRRTLDPGALFAVHSWRDALGREPADFAPDAPENRLYLDYYAEMGMSPEQARAFYAMTNSVPHHGALWLEGAEMARWIAPEARTPATRHIDAPLEATLRHALARSGRAARDAVRAPFDRLAARDELRPLAALAFLPDLPVEALPVPRLAYADAGAGLLDSGAAFP